MTLKHKIFSFVLGATALLAIAVKTEAQVAHTSLQKADRHNSESRFDSAAFYLELAVEAFTANEQWDSVVAHTYTLGDRYRKAGDLLQAIERMESGYDLLQQKSPEDTALAIRYHHYLGYLFGILGNLDLKIHHYQQKLDLLTAWKGTEDLDAARMTMFIGNAYNQKGDMPTALNYLENAYELFSKYHASEFAHRANASINLGLAYYHSGQYRQALGQYAQARKLRLEVMPADHPEVINTWNYLGDGFKAADQLDSALHYYSLANKAYQAMRHPLRAQSLKGLAEIYRAQQKSEAAFDLLQEGLIIEQAHDGLSSRELAKSLVNIGNCALEIGMSETGHDFFQQALAAFFPELSTSSQNPTLDETQTDPWVLLALLGKARASKQAFDRTGDLNALELALETYDRGAAQVDIMRQSFQSNQAKEGLSERIYEVYAEGAIAAIEHQRRSGNQAMAEKVFLFLERGKANFLREKFREAQLRLPGSKTTELIAALQQNEQKLRYLKGRDKHLPEGGQKQRNQELLTQSERQHAQLLDSLQMESNSLQHWYDHSQMLNTRALQEWLSEKNTTVLEITSVGNQLIAAVATSDTVLAYARTSKKDWERKVNELIQWVSTPPNGSEDFRKSLEVVTESHELFEWIFEPLEGIDLGNHLVIIADGYLEQLPFELLMTSSVNSDRAEFRSLPYLLNDFAISYAHSAQLLLEQHMTGSSNPSTEAMAIGLSYSNEEAETLPNAKAETELVQSLLPTQVLFDKAATKSAFLRLAPEADLLHITAHAELVWRDPLKTSVLLHSPTDQGLDSLKLEDIYANPLKAQMVVLSACNTGIGNQIKGEGQQSIARAFVYAGCPSTIMSLWTVSDHATLKLMQSFYDHIKVGSSKDEALRQAKRDYLEATREAQFTHPFYWAAFVASGNTEPIDTPEEQSTPMIWLSVLALILLLTWIFLFKTLKRSS